MPPALSFRGCCEPKQRGSGTSLPLPLPLPLRALGACLRDCAWMPLAQGPQASLSPLLCRSTSPLGPTTRLPHRLCFRIYFPLQYNHLSVKYKSWKERQPLNTQLSVASLRLPEGKEGEQGLQPCFTPPQRPAPADRELTGVTGGDAV